MLKVRLLWKEEAGLYVEEDHKAQVALVRIAGKRSENTLLILL